MKGFDKKGRGQAGGGFVRSIAVGSGISILITLLLCAAAAAMTDKQVLKPDWNEVAALAVHLLASLAGCMVAAKMAKGRSMIVCLTTGAMYFLALMILSAAVFGGSFQGVLKGLGTILGVSAVAGLLGAAPRSQKGKRYKFG